MQSDRVWLNGHLNETNWKCFWYVLLSLAINVMHDANAKCIYTTTFIRSLWNEKKENENKSIVNNPPSSIFFGISFHSEVFAVVIITLSDAAAVIIIMFVVVVVAIIFTVVCDFLPEKNVIAFDLLLSAAFQRNKTKNIQKRAKEKQFPSSSINWCIRNNHSILAKNET